MKVTPFTILSLSSIEYNELQQKAITKALQEAESNTDPFVEYHWSNQLVEAKGTVWALFGETAYELFPFTDAGDMAGTTFEYVPMVVKGKMLRQAPDEGRLGIGYLIRCISKGGQEQPEEWRVVYMELGWLRKSELDLPADEVLSIMAEEADAGLPVFVRLPHGRQ